MRYEKHLKTNKEVIDEIKSAMEDSRGISFHQRRLVFMLSLGAANLIEIYLHKQLVIKPGGKIEHQWFKSKKETINNKIEQQLIGPIDALGRMDALVRIAQSLERNRNDLTYGAPVKDEKLLLDRVNKFLELKKLVEAEINEKIN